MIHKILMTAVTLLAVLTMSACFSSQVKTKAAPSGGPIEVSHAHLIFGLVSPDPVDLKALCPNGISKIENIHTFGDGCLGAITFNIYTPNTSYITCAGGGAFLLGQDEKGEVVQVVDVTEQATEDKGL